MPSAPGDSLRNDAQPPCAPETGAELIATLHRQLDDLREAVASHERIGITTGILAHRLDCSPERAWQILVQLSQATNVKLRAVAQILVDAHCGRLHEDDAELSARLEGLLAVRAAEGPTGSGPST